MENNKIYCGDSLQVLKTLPDESVNCCVASPPYWGLRDYSMAGQLGLEKTPKEYVVKMVEVFKEVKRVLKKEGTLWLNLGDSYAGGGQGGHADGKVNKLVKYPKIKNPFDIGLKPKDLVGIPWRVAFALQADGWYLRQDIIWHKPNPMPESVTDRCTKSHEYIFLLAKSQKYYFDNKAIQEIATGYDGRKDTKMKGSNKYKQSVMPGQIEHTMAARGHERWQRDINNNPIRNKRSVWTVSTKPFKGAHFATFPEDLIRPCILAGCPKDGTVLDPFAGAGTTCLVAKKLGRNYIGIELNPDYVKMAENRISSILF